MPGRTPPEDRVELNDRAFVLSPELAESLSAARVIYRCLQCDPSGHEYHLDREHTVEDLRGAGAIEWTPHGVPTSAVVRVPIFLAHHESKGGA